MQIIVDKAKLTKREEMEMTTDIHDRGSERSHNNRKKDAKTIGKK
jgi:hypothetical protein